jgi:hypothetical protein
VRMAELDGRQVGVDELQSLAEANYGRFTNFRTDEGWTDETASEACGCGWNGLTGTATHCSDFPGRRLTPTQHPARNSKATMLGTGNGSRCINRFEPRTTWFQ